MARDSVPPLTPADLWPEMDPSLEGDRAPPSLLTILYWLRPPVTEARSTSAEPYNGGQEDLDHAGRLHLRRDPHPRRPLRRGARPGPHRRPGRDPDPHSHGAPREG